MADLGERGLTVGAGRDGFGEPEIDYARDRLAIDFNDKDVRGLEVAMDDGLLVSVLNALTGLDKKLKALLDSEPFLIAVGSDGLAGDVLHDEVRLTLVGGSGIEDLGNRGVVHDGERLALGLKALDDRRIVHAGFDQLERN